MEMMISKLETKLSLKNLSRVQYLSLIVHRLFDAGVLNTAHHFNEEIINDVIKLNDAVKVLLVQLCVPMLQRLYSN